MRRGMDVYRYIGGTASGTTAVVAVVVAAAAGLRVRRTFAGPRA